MFSHQAVSEPKKTPSSSRELVSAPALLKELEAKGAVLLPRLVSTTVLQDMRAAFESRLVRMRWNNCDGYERGERFRFVVQDVLTLAQGFVDVALHPLIKSILDAYLGPRYELCEAKGWKSLPTRKDFHGWHADMWYDQTKVTDHIPREVKLAFYLSDVRSGAFQYVAGSHAQRAPRHLRHDEVKQLPMERMIEFLGPAGTAILFDTSGIHRQGIPILEPRRAVFYNYHDPEVPLQAEDVEYYRYHPLLLNAALLGNLSAQDCHILGFGTKTNYQPNYARSSAHPWLHATGHGLIGVTLWANEFAEKVRRRARRLLRRQ
jgi:hypothetical protein